MKLILFITSVACIQFAITYYYEDKVNVYTLQTRIYTNEGSRLNGTSTCNYIDDGEFLCEGKECKQPPLAALTNVSKFGKETWFTGHRTFRPDISKQYTLFHYLQNSTHTEPIKTYIIGKWILYDNKSACTQVDNGKQLCYNGKCEDSISELTFTSYKNSGGELKVLERTFNNVCQ